MPVSRGALQQPSDQAPSLGTDGGLPPTFTRWFEARGWAPHAHQLAMLEAAQAGQSALLTAPTGGGKTLAGFLPSLVELAGQPDFEGLHTLYIRRSRRWRPISAEISKPRWGRWGWPSPPRRGRVTRLLTAARASVSACRIS